MYDQLSDPAVKEAALLNLAFFSVAAKLLDPQWDIPTIVEDDVQVVLTLIESAAGFDKEWFMDQMEDFSQYIPRGHYTKSDSFKRFFKAMMWYGRIGFRLTPDDPWRIPAENREKGREETLQAILATLSLYRESSHLPGVAEARGTWSSIYDITSFFVGTSDDLSPFEYNTVIDAVYGNITNLNSPGDTDVLDTFISTALTCRDPMILSGYLMDAADVANNTKGFRFMGQRFVPDSYILGQLVHKNVDMRLMPKGLDVMAAYGSEVAWELLED